MVRKISPVSNNMANVLFTISGVAEPNPQAWVTKIIGMYQDSMLAF
jgi:hypothetical protein